MRNDAPDDQKEYGPEDEVRQISQKALSTGAQHHGFREHDIENLRLQTDPEREELRPEKQRRIAGEDSQTQHVPYGRITLRRDLAFGRLNFQRPNRWHRVS